MTQRRSPREVARLPSPMMAATAAGSIGTMHRTPKERLLGTEVVKDQRRVNRRRRRAMLEAYVAA